MVQTDRLAESNQPNIGTTRTAITAHNQRTASSSTSRAHRTIPPQPHMLHVGAHLDLAWPYQREGTGVGGWSEWRPKASNTHMGLEKEVSRTRTTGRSRYPASSFPGTGLGHA